MASIGGLFSFILQDNPLTGQMTLPGPFPISGKETRLREVM